MKETETLMTEEVKKEYIRLMTENLPTLRKRAHFSQVKLAEIVGASRSTITNLESRRTPMTWNMFLALVCVFDTNRSTKAIAEAMGIVTPELKNFLQGK